MSASGETINNFLSSYNFHNNIHEGYSQEIKGQTDFLKNKVNNDSINSVMEIGFNAGHSAELFLSTNKNINLVSFDIGHFTMSNWVNNLLIKLIQEDIH